MRKFVILLALVALLCPFMNAQQRAGNIEGRVFTADGEALPGVLVTVTSDVSGKMTAVTNEQGIYRFRQLAPSRSYVISAELEGFNKAVKTNVQVSLGVNTKVDLTLELGQITKEIVVEGKAAVVDSKSTSVNAIVTRQELQSIPTGRDPFVIMAMAPGVQTDRHNMAGSESGQQATSVGRGEGSYSNTIWNVDGINVTDPAAIGATPTYWDFDAFEEMNVSTGGADVTIQSGGIALNMVTRRGGNNHRLGGRFYLTDTKFETEVTQETLDEIGVPGTVNIRNIKDYGFNLGGPILKDKIFYWLSFGVQDIKTSTVYGANDDTLLTNYAFKVNVQIIESNRLEFFLHAGGKTKEGRSASKTMPSGLGQGGQSHFGSPIIKLQDEQTIGDSLFLSLKWAFSDAGFKLWPMIDPDMENLQWRDMDTGIQTGSYWIYDVKRPKTNYALHLTYFNDNLLGGSHEIKIGGEITNAHQEVLYGQSGTGGALYRHNYPSPQLDLDGDGSDDLIPGWGRFEVWKPYYMQQYLDSYTAFIQDTMTYGNWTFRLGLRYDKLTPFLKAYSLKAIYEDHPVFTDNVDSETIGKLAGLIPGSDIPEVKDSDWGRSYISPRIGITYDLNGDGTTILKLSGAVYGFVSGVGLSEDMTPYGAGGWMDMWHKDNGDGMINWSELYWFRYGANNEHIPMPMFDAGGGFIGDASYMKERMWGGYDWANKSGTSPSRILIDGQNHSPATYELLATGEKEISRDFALQINGTYRKTNNFREYNRYYNDTGQSAQGPQWWGQAGTVPSSIPGLGSTEGAAGKPYYMRSNDYVSTAYEMYEERPGFYRDYMAVDFVITKRLSNKWQASGSVSLQTQAQHWGDSTSQNPTNKWALDGKVFAPQVGGSSGKIDQYMFSNWMVKFTGLYQLPWGLNVSGNFTAHQGNILPRNFDIKDYRWTNAQFNTTTVYMEEFGKTRTDTIWNIDLRLEKELVIGENQRIHLMVDLFNIFNKHTVDRKRYLEYGTYYIYADPAKNKWVENLNSGGIEGVLNPRVFRFGVRFQF